MSNVTETVRRKCSSEWECHLLRDTFNMKRSEMYDYLNAYTDNLNHDLTANPSLHVRLLVTHVEDAQIIKERLCKSGTVRFTVVKVLQHV